MVAVLPDLADDGLYTVKQTCEALGIHRNTLRSWTGAGYIRCEKRLGRLIYRGLAIKQFFYNTVR